MNTDGFNGPADPFDDNFSQAVMMHETLQSFINAGFTREEAFTFVRDMLTMSMQAAIISDQSE